MDISVQNPNINNCLLESFYNTDLRYTQNDAMRIEKEFTDSRKKVYQKLENIIRDGCKTYKETRTISSDAEKYIKIGLDELKRLRPYDMEPPINNHLYSYFNESFINELTKKWIKNKDNIVFMCWYTNLANHTQLISRKLLDSDLFNKAVIDVISKYNFTEIPINNICDLQNIAGIYFMVLDNELVFYAGYSKNIYQRIKQHWNKTDECTYGIDLYSKEHTTRIYYYPVCTKNEYSQYEDLIDDMEMNIITYLMCYYSDFTLNTCCGGKPQKNLFKNIKF